MADIQWIKILVNLFNGMIIKQMNTLPQGSALIVLWLKLLLPAGSPPGYPLHPAEPDRPTATATVHRAASAGVLETFWIDRRQRWSYPPQHHRVTSS